MTEGTIEGKKGKNIERRGKRAGQTACKQLANLKRFLDALQFSDKAQPAEAAAAADQRRCMHPPALACPPCAGRGTSEVTQHASARMKII